MREVVSFFTNILNNGEGFDYISQTTMLSYIPRLVLEEQNKMLTENFSNKEVELALKQLHLDTTLGSDRFLSSFF